MAEYEELREIVLKELGQAGMIDEHVHLPTIVATLRLVGERIQTIEEKMAGLAKRIEELEKKNDAKDK